MVYNSTLGNGDLRKGTGTGCWVDGSDVNEDIITRLVTSGDNIHVYWEGAHPTSLHGMP